MRLNLNHPIVYCPRCYSLNVRLQYDTLDLDQDYQKALRMGSLGLVGILGSLLSKKRDFNGHTYWVCQDCASTFPVKGGEQR